MEVSYKLSQNRNNLDYANIIHELMKKKDAHSRGIAGAMKNLGKHEDKKETSSKNR